VWFDEVKKADVNPETVYEQIAGHHESVTVLGASGGAKLATEMLNKHEIEVQNYAVSDEYYIEGKVFLSRPVISFSQLKLRGGICPRYRSSNEL